MVISHWWYCEMHREQMARLNTPDYSLYNHKCELFTHPHPQIILFRVESKDPPSSFKL